MPRRPVPPSLSPLCLAVVFAVLFAAPVLAQPALSPEAGPYDNGKMWTFENPPLDYLADTYGLEPDAAWFERARMSALRIPGCSASFVSPHGLVVTNHHCVRSRVSAVSRPGEGLLDNGFVAASLDEERPIPGYYADQLVAIEDVTDEVYAALDAAETDAERAEAREAAFAAITERITTDRGEDNTEVQIIALYNGGRYSAYVFHRYTDVRLVMAAELQAGFFGGEWDNFTYPRYALDFAFLRIYGDDGQPLQTEHYFTWSTEGVETGDLIFVIGNPGSTNRLETVSQLEYRRDVFVPHTLRFLNTRLEALRGFFAEHPEEGEAMDIRNIIFSLSNGQKAYAGRDAALNEPVILTRRADAENQFRTRVEEALTEAFADILANPGGAAYDDVADLFDAVAAIQTEKREYGAAFGAFRLIDNGAFTSATIRRAMAAHAYLKARTEGVGDERLAELRDALTGIGDLPADLERRLLAARLADFAHYFGPDDMITQAALGSRSPEEAATALLSASPLASAASTMQAVESDNLTLGDPAVALAAAFLPRRMDFDSASAGLGAREGDLNARLGRARFEVYGTDVPPDATFSPRFTDGIVQGYEYNGTIAPPYTTFFGMYDRANGYGADEIEWQLPARWKTPPPGLDLSTPLNFVSTSDTIGGNSGSPAVTPTLAIVGLNFDRNIEGLVRDYIYLPERGRNIMVDVRAIKEALDVVYDADRLVLEFTTGTLAPTEADADAQMD